jgi:RNA transcription, translation and transport factor protein
MMHSVQLLLRTLQHPQADSVHEDALRNLVPWLEDRKIRAYKLADRPALTSTESSDWQGVYDTVRTRLQGVVLCHPCVHHAQGRNNSFFCTLLQYLQHVGCPAAVRNKDTQSQLLWLLRLAIAREYEDDSKQRHCPHHGQPSVRLCSGVKTCSTVCVTSQQCLLRAQRPRWAVQCLALRHSQERQ